MVLYKVMFSIVVLGVIAMLARLIFMRGWERKKEVFGQEVKTLYFVKLLISIHKIMAYGLIFFS